jgi:hypothetical protein
MAPPPKAFVLERRESTRSKTTSEALQSESAHASVTVFALGPLGVRPGRYALFSCYVDRLESDLGEIYVIDLSTSSTMTHFSIYFASIDWFFKRKTRLTPLSHMSHKRANGSTNAGGTSSRTFAEDGEASYSSHHITYVFSSSARMEPQ